jgi:hypothetical protein
MERVLLYSTLFEVTELGDERVVIAFVREV